MTLTQTHTWEPCRLLSTCCGSDRFFQGCRGREHGPRGKVQGCRTASLLSFPPDSRPVAPISTLQGTGGPVGLVINVLSRREVQSGPLPWSLVVSASHQLRRNPGQGEMFLKEENYPESVSQRKVGSEKVCPCCKALSLSPPAKLKAYPTPPWDFW